MRKQVYLSPEQSVRLKQMAKREQLSEAAILRTALDRFLAEDEPRTEDLAKDPLWGIIGVSESSDADLSERVDEYLYGRRRS